MYLSLLTVQLICTQLTISTQSLTVCLNCKNGRLVFTPHLQNIIYEIRKHLHHNWSVLYSLGQGGYSLKKISTITAREFSELLLPNLVVAMTVNTHVYMAMVKVHCNCAGKKGKDTPLPDASSLLPVPEKLPTEMKKRGVENFDSKYLSKFLRLPKNFLNCFGGVYRFLRIL